MKKKRARGRKKPAALLAVVLSLTMCVTTFGTLDAFAEESTPSAQQNTQSASQNSKADLSIPEPDASQEDTTAGAKDNTSQNPTEESSKTDNAESETAKDAASTETESGDEAKNDSSDSVIDESKVGELKLVYGNESLADEDAFVLLILGDGFTKDQQDKFYEEARKTAEYVMGTSPYDEFKDTIKFYALGTESEDSGAIGEDATSYEEANNDTRKTFFGTRFWVSGMERLLGFEGESDDDPGMDKVRALRKEYMPATDYSMIIVNSDKYGGSGGTICAASLNSSAKEIMVHEMGHMVGNLADEYWAGISYANEDLVNMTQESDPTKVKWARFVGKNGVGVYPYSSVEGKGWYHPSENCKMLYLGKDHPFCEVCKEQLRKSISQASNVTNLFFQPYADRFYESDSGKDMSEYFIIRKGTNETTGDKLGGALKLEYTDSDGNKVDGTPSKAGTYTVKATFSGNDTYGSATQTGTYTIELPDLIDLKVSDKVSDGKPIDVDFTVDYDKEYTSKVHYTGTMPYTTEQKDKYDSDEAPVRPGDYTVTVKIYDKETGKEVSEDSQTFKIKFNKTKVVNNDDQNYWGATTGYNLKHVTITGEGFTADEEDEFQKLAKEYIDYILDTEPFKETKQYFNFTTVESLSNESGIGNSPAKDTYMQLTRDDFGRI